MVIALSIALLGAFLLPFISPLLAWRADDDAGLPTEWKRRCE
jgi:hypothetical protein